MKKIFVVLVAVGLVSLMSFQMTKNQVPYFSTKLSSYSEEANINTFGATGSVTLETYAKMKTGLEDFQVYIGTGKQGEIRDFPLYWLKFESPRGEIMLYIDMSKSINESSNTCRDTIRVDNFSRKTERIALEIVHLLSTDEIQYIWLDGNNNRTETAIFIPIEQPEKK
jgi:hypothetical protein